MNKILLSAMTALLTFWGCIAVAQDAPQGLNQYPQMSEEYKRGNDVVTKNYEDLDAASAEMILRGRNHRFDYLSNDQRRELSEQTSKQWNSMTYPQREQWWLEAYEWRLQPSAQQTNPPPHPAPPSNADKKSEYYIKQKP